MWNVTEQPWTIVGAAVICLLIVWVIRRTFPDKARLWLFVIPLAIAGAGFLIDRLVVTDREQIIITLKTVIKGVEENTPDTIEKFISEDYSDSRHRTKMSLMSHCRVVLTGKFIEKAIPGIAAMQINNNDATVTLTVRLVFDPQSIVAQNYRQMMLVKMEVSVKKQNVEIDKSRSRWLIRRAELEELDLMPIKWKDIKFDPY